MSFCYLHHQTQDINSIRLLILICFLLTFSRAEKERKKAEKKAKKAAQAAAEAAANKVEDVTYLSFDEQDSYSKMGDMTRVMSRSRTGREFAKVEDLEDAEKYPAGSKVWLRGRLHSIRVKGGSCFLVLRQGSFNTVQALFFKDKEDPEGSKKMLNYLKTLTVDILKTFL